MKKVQPKGLPITGFNLNKPTGPGHSYVDNDSRNLSAVTPTYKDGAQTITNSRGISSTFLFTNGVSLNEPELVSRYRRMLNNPHVDKALASIFNQSIVRDAKKESVKINLDKLDLSKDIKDKINEEFNEIYKLLKFKEYGYDLFSQWYIDGRLYFQVIVDDDMSKAKEEGDI